MHSDVLMQTCMKLGENGLRQDSRMTRINSYHYICGAPIDRLYSTTASLSQEFSFRPISDVVLKLCSGLQWP